MATDDVETRGLRGYLAGENDGPGGAWRVAAADDYDEPLAGMVRRGECEPPDEFVIDDEDAGR